MKSPLRYPGGKTRAIKILADYIPIGCKEICSPFIGGGSFELYLESTGIQVYGYDNFQPLVEFWQMLRSDKQKLNREVKSYHPISKDEFYDLQKYMRSEKYTVGCGSVFYVLNRCSFSGSTLSGGISPNTPRFTIKGIEKLLTTDIKCDVELKSFEQSIPLHDCLIFADPPYYISQSLYGNKGDMHKGFNHTLLADMLMKRGNFILTYNDCPEIRELYKGCKFDVVSWSYGMNKSKLSNELIITP